MGIYVEYQESTINCILSILGIHAKKINEGRVFVTNCASCLIFYEKVAEIMIRNLSIAYQDCNQKGEFAAYVKISDLQKKGPFPEIILHQR